jgi:hypothetical protein
MRLISTRLAMIENCHKPHASNAASGSCFGLKIVCLDNRSALAMTDGLGGLARSRASLMRSNVARS